MSRPQYISTLNIAGMVLNNNKRTIKFNIMKHYEELNYNELVLLSISVLWERGSYNSFASGKMEIN